jgi:apolipoprotein N-acyltransferase
MTQLENLPILQLASLFGSSAIGFLVAWAASLGAQLPASRERRRYLLDTAVLGIVLLSVFAYGSIRLFSEQGRTVTTAGIVTDIGPGPQGLPDKATLSRNDEDLFRRSAVAAGQGARLIVWNEGATVVEKADEQAFIDRGTRLARERGVDLVLAYIVPISTAPLRFENKYAWIGEEGAVLETYNKHHPVPGEGSLRSFEPLRILARPFGSSAGAICYDYDFPAMAVAHGRLGAGLVVVPSSDWKGIDPYHSQNVRVRAIEGGFSVVRPTRWATSTAFDAYGRLRGALSAFEVNERILIATVPTEHIPTLYSQIGDAVALAYAAYLLCITLLAALKAKAHRQARRPRYQKTHA